MYDLFPNDVRMEVLRRLPFSSLLRLRRINKSWRDIIDSPSFRKLHVQNRLSYNDDEDPVLLQFIYNVRTPHDGQAVFLRSIYGFRISQELTVMHLGLYIQQYTGHNDELIYFSRSVHGLICLYNASSTNRIFLCNPSLGEIKVLPSSSSPRRCFRVVGLGYDEVEKDYKVVQFSSDMSLLPRDEEPIVEVYSRKRNTWRVLPDHPVYKSYNVYKQIQHVEPSSAAVDYFRGLIKEGTDGFEILGDAIFSFDMRNEALEMIKIPCIVSLSMNRIYAKENSSFIMFSRSCGSNEMIIWEYEREWIKVGKLGPLFDRGVWPVATWKRNGLIFKIDSEKSELVLFDISSREIIKYFQIPVGKYLDLEYVQYRGSFISP